MDQKLQPRHQQTAIQIHLKQEQNRFIRVPIKETRTTANPEVKTTTRFPLHQIQLEHAVKRKGRLNQ